MIRIFALGLTLLATPVAAQDVNGIWKTETSAEGAYLHVTIGPCSYDTTKTCGVIGEAFNSARNDLVGKAIITGMEPATAGRWNKGQIWAPDDDKTYRSNMELSGDQLKVEGCVAVFCRGQTWVRLK